MASGTPRIIAVSVIVGVAILASVWCLTTSPAAATIQDGMVWEVLQWLTGVAVTVVIVLLILRATARPSLPAAAPRLKRCRVCDHVLLRQGLYCPECGSRL